MTKREIKRQKQRQRKAELDLIRANAEANRQFQEELKASAREKLEHDENFSVHAGCFEIIAEMASIAADEIHQIITPLGIENAPIRRFADGLKAFTDEQVARQDKYFIDPSEENLNAFAEKCDFIYKMLPLLAKMPVENRVKAEATLKVLQKK